MVEVIYFDSYIVIISNNVQIFYLVYSAILYWSFAELYKKAGQSELLCVCFKKSIDKTCQSDRHELFCTRCKFPVAKYLSLLMF